MPGLHLNGDNIMAGRQERVNQREHDASQHAAEHAADGTLDRFVGADDGCQLVLAERAACKVGSSIPAPGEAEDQQNEINGVIAVLCKRQAALEVDQRIEAEHDNPGEIDIPRELAEIQRLYVGDLTDVEEQYQQKAERQDQGTHSLAAGKHDQQGERHGSGIQIPLLFAKAHGAEHLMDGQQADGTKNKIKNNGIEKCQYNGQNSQADSGGDNAGLHTVFPFTDRFNNSLCGHTNRHTRTGKVGRLMRRAQNQTSMISLFLAAQVSSICLTYLSVSFWVSSSSFF